MKKNMARYVLYIACVVLAAFYVLVLWWGKNPQVGREYRMYYITHELTDWPGYGNLEYSFGTKEYCLEYKDRAGREINKTVCSRKGQGWQKEKRYEGTRNTAGQSYVYYVPKTSADNAVLVCDITDYEVNNASDYGVLVYVNDTLAGSIDKKGVTQIDIGHVNADELLTVKFVSDNVAFTLYSISLDDKAYNN